MFAVLAVSVGWLAGGGTRADPRSRTAGCRDMAAAAAVGGTAVYMAIAAEVR